MPRGTDEKNQRWAHTPSLSFRIQVLRQKIHQLERTPAVDHLVDQIALTARQLLDHALRRGPDGFVGPMDTCREQQHERSVSEVHGKTQKICTAVYRLFSFSYQHPNKTMSSSINIPIAAQRDTSQKDGEGLEGNGESRVRALSEKAKRPLILPFPGRPRCSICFATKGKSHLRHPP